MDLLAAQVEEAIAQPLIFRNLLVAGHLKRQRLGRRENLDRLDVDFDPAGRQRRIDVLFRAPSHLAGDADDAFRTHRLGAGKRRRALCEHALRDAVVIAQVDEQQLSVVALAMHPAGQLDRLADVLRSKNGAGM